MTTCAPCAANFSAMARPMPRDPPVTTPTCPERSIAARSLLGQQFVEVENLHLASDATHERRQDLARSHLDNGLDAYVDEGSHRFLPAHWCCHLFHQKSGDARLGRDRSGF